ncbi:DUF2857 family protein [Salinicola corii]|uniref:DUF2857 family protein n=1 Tax=Salinicola corii TaxID=2606937 RepID=A0A640WAC5_9GAMM|nr:STY4526/YPO1902 family pathogenicity island replication protein [Salinicola corii]KAA0016992.1 DUF2857 family protein [Salinicola corii]
MATPQLNHALFNQALILIREGDMRRARALGFRDDELQSLSRLRASEIESLIHEFPGVARFELDHDTFKAALRRVDRDQDRDGLVDHCIRHGASVCSGSMKPDTSVGGILPTLSEVSYGKKTTTILQP